MWHFNNRDIWTRDIQTRVWARGLLFDYQGTLISPVFYQNSNLLIFDFPKESILSGPNAYFVSPLLLSFTQTLQFACIYVCFWRVPRIRQVMDAVVPGAMGPSHSFRFTLALRKTFIARRALPVIRRHLGPSSCGNQSSYVIMKHGETSAVSMLTYISRSVHMVAMGK